MNSSDNEPTCNVQQEPFVIPPKGQPEGANVSIASTMDIKFSPKELDVLNECNIDALIKRALPLGHGMASLCWLGHEKGFLKPSRRMGGVRKIASAYAVGLCLGFLSYQPECVSRLMSTSDSKHGKLLKDKYGY